MWHLHLILEDTIDAHIGKGIQAGFLNGWLKCMEYLGLFFHFPLYVTYSFPGYNERGPDEPPTSTYLCL